MGITIGIDPGLSGACAVLEDGVWVEFFDTPVFKVGSKKEYNVNEMAKFLSSHLTATIFIEKQLPIPRQSSQSTFKTGYGFGLWIGIIVSLNLPYTIVHPRTWKKKMLKDMAKEKDASRSRAIQLFPGASDHLNLKKHHDRAEALLLAEYGRICRRL